MPGETHRPCCSSVLSKLLALDWTSSVSTFTRSLWPHGDQTWPSVYGHQILLLLCLKQVVGLFGLLNAVGSSTVRPFRPSPCCRVSCYTTMANQVMGRGELQISKCVWHMSLGEVKDGGLI